ncbi:endoplasmic reticulum aminopeptidase 2-like [Saccostrea echinata]|uniref:endoplasmic reticulum aminopeptidase 2-like n=1 Tax=Saccostrea echinata TaxID=191078 RepID=UPI002A81B414|nr:endoplasmic reticulum aminopeptidase 2-like [Saccostrea echinata]
MEFTTDKNTTSEDSIADKHLPWKHFRLPSSVLPSEYDIFLHPNLTEGTFSGKVSIKCRVVQATNFLVLHSKDLNISDVTVKSSTHSKILNVTRYLELKEKDQFYVQVDNVIPNDTDIVINMKFEGEFAPTCKGFYLSSYFDDRKNSTRLLASTQFETMHAREAFPCFDEPAMKAKFSVSIVREKDYFSLFNMPIRSSTAYSENLVLDEFHQSVTMSSYLVTFVVCDFSSITDNTKDGTKVTVYATPDRINDARYALHVIVIVLDYFNRLFDIPYPLPKLDYISIPNFCYAAMENWGLITSAKEAMLVSSNTSIRQKNWVSEVISHELAHQWFGNLLTMKWWNDLWLNEGLATFMSYLGRKALNESFEMDIWLYDRVIALAMKCDQKRSSAVVSPVNDKKDVSSFNFCPIYMKGASIIQMVREFIGEANFDTGIKNYLRKYNYSSVVTEDLWQSISEVQSPKERIDLKSAMDGWTNQKGYPIVTVSRQETEVKISQIHNTFNKSPTSNASYKWQVPFIYGVLQKNGSWTRNRIWLQNTSETLHLETSDILVKGNFGSSGYYRVDYDTETWNVIIEQLKRNHSVFPKVDRLGLLQDAFEFTRNSRLNITIPLEIMQYLTKENEFIFWMNGIRSLRNLISDLKEGDVDIKRYLVNVVKTRSKTLPCDHHYSSSPYETKLLCDLFRKVLSTYDKENEKEKLSKRLMDNGMDNSERLETLLDMDPVEKVFRDHDQIKF